jgi:hypothetical protein
MNSKEEDIKKKKLASLLELKEAKERNEVFTEDQDNWKQTTALAFPQATRTLNLTIYIALFGSN